MIGAAISAGASLLGGALQNSANRKAADKQAALQREFAQSGIQWKVNDAKKAGIHPLYALGANTISYSPQSVGGSDFSSIAQAGQNIGRAIDVTRSQPAKLEAFQTTAAQLQNEGLALDNELKRTQLASATALTRQAGGNPGIPSPSTTPALVGLPGQGNTPQLDGPKIEIEKRISPAMPDTGGAAEYGASPEVSLYKSKGGYSPQVPQGLSESFEQDIPSFLQWYVRNKIMPAFGSKYMTKPNETLAPNHVWTYDPLSGQYYQRYRPYKWKREEVRTR